MDLDDEELEATRILTGATRKTTFKDMINTIILGDSYKLIKDIPDKSIDCIYIDVPYLMPNTKGKSGGFMAERVNKIIDQELKNIKSGFDFSILDEMVRVNKNLNIFIWCNKFLVKQILDYNAQFYKKDTSLKRKELVTKFQLDESKKVEQLSLGNLKKLGIVLALVHDPKLIILDEPTSGLDPIMQDVFYNILKEEREKGNTIFYSTHILSEIKKICDRVGIIKDGNLIKVETLKEMKNNNLVIVTIKSRKIANIKTELKFKILEETEEEIKILYNDDINKLIKLLECYNLEKLLIEELSIEDMFIHYYK